MFLLVFLSESKIPGQAGNDVTPGTDNVTSGTDNVTPGTDNVTPVTDNVTPGTDNVTPGTDRVSFQNRLGSSSFTWKDFRCHGV